MPILPVWISYFVPAKAKFFRVIVGHIINLLLTKREVKMAGYWPCSSFAFLWTLTSSQSIEMQKKITCPVSSHLHLTLNNVAEKKCISCVFFVPSLQKTKDYVGRHTYPLVK